MDLSVYFIDSAALPMCIYGPGFNTDKCSMYVRMYVLCMYVYVYMNARICMYVYMYVLYCLELQLVSYKCLVSFSGWGNSIITKINTWSQINAGPFVGPQ